MCRRAKSDLREFWSACRLPEAHWAAALERFARFRELIESRNAELGLMGRVGPEDFYRKHVADSLSVLLAYPRLLAGSVALADVGCGAGLPGLVLAIALPQLRLTAIESNRRKADFAAGAARELDLGGRVTVLARRSRELGYEQPWRGAFDVVVARAVGPAERLIRDTRMLLGEAGSAILYKTPQGVARELARARRKAARHGLSVETSDVVALPAGAGRRQFIRLFRAR